MSKEQQAEALRLAGECDASAEQWLNETNTRRAAASTIRRLHAENEALRRELIKEAARTASEKRRADQMSLQHSMQAALNREAREKLARYAAAEISDQAQHGGDA